MPWDADGWSPAPKPDRRKPEDGAVSFKTWRFGYLNNRRGLLKITLVSAVLCPLSSLCVHCRLNYTHYAILSLSAWTYWRVWNSYVSFCRIRLRVAPLFVHRTMSRSSVLLCCYWSKRSHHRPYVSVVVCLYLHVHRCVFDIVDGDFSCSPRLHTYLGRLVWHGVITAM